MQQHSEDAQQLTGATTSQKTISTQDSGSLKQHMWVLILRQLFVAWTSCMPIGTWHCPFEILRNDYNGCAQHLMHMVAGTG